MLHLELELKLSYSAMHSGLGFVLVKGFGGREERESCRAHRTTFFEIRKTFRPLLPLLMGSNRTRCA